jgi:hypothetical protein
MPSINIQGRRRYSWLWIVLVLPWAGNQETRSAAEHAADGPDTHNMLVVGERAVYLSHLPMFQEQGKRPMPHRYQAILEVSLTKRDSDPDRDYVEDRQKHRAIKIYTLNPEEFVLPTLVSTNPPQKPLRSFKAEKVLRGHLERPGNVAILQDVQVNVKQVVHFREFDPKGEKPAELEYLLFGKTQELFLAHLITRPPDFDQILSVKVSDNKFTDEELAKGIPVVFPGTTNTPAARLKSKQRLPGELKGKNAPVPRKIQVEVDAELFLEEGELRVPADFETTPEEKLAGFP